jgi:hypothetical protein
VDYARINLTFLSADEGGRQRAPALDAGIYRPHFRVGTHGEYLGVAFVVGPRNVTAGEEVSATVRLVYADLDVDYGPLQEGVSFEVLEGRHVVARGVVTRRFQSDREPGDWPC